MPVFFIHSNQISGHLLYLTDPLARHIGSSLRHRPGDQITVIDERRMGYVVQLMEVKPQQIIGKILGEKRQAPVSSLNITLSQSLLKGKKMDWVIQKATELGVSRIVPTVTERTIVDLKPERTEGQLHRWGEILKEAAQQAGRWEVPRLDPPTNFQKITEEGPTFDLSLIPWEGESHKDLKQALKEAKKINPTIEKVLVLIGPEGGFTHQEVAHAIKHKIISVHLGWRILRAETACLSTLAMIQYEMGDIS